MSQKRRGFEAGLSQSGSIPEAPDDSTAALEPSSSSSFRSSPLTDRASTFIAVFSRSESAKRLQDDPAFRSATHRIAAWRHPSRQRSLTPHRPVHETGFDDDGEKYAGKRLEKLLVSLDVCGAVVVARWYGGALLGPVRFEHIENCAREAIRRCQASEHEPPLPAKRLKLAIADPTLADQRIPGGGAADALRSRLSVTLERRDESITTLRTLLAEKQSRSVTPAKSGTVVKRPQYSNLGLDALRRLEKARDSTIAWLLKEIDKAEVDSNHQQDKPVSLAEPNVSGRQLFPAEELPSDLAESEAEALETGAIVKNTSTALGSTDNDEPRAGAASSSMASALLDARNQSEQSLQSSSAEEIT